MKIAGGLHDVSQTHEQDRRAKAEAIRLSCRQRQGQKEFGGDNVLSGGGKLFGDASTVSILKAAANNVIDRIAISGYRSIRSIILRLGQLNVVTGANGSGKSNLYRALRLIADAADGRLAESLAREGGFGSVRWAGPKKSGNDPVSLRLGFTADPLSYCFDLGLPQPSESMFGGDPEMKRECLWRGIGMDAKNLCADRRVGTLRCRGAKGKWQDIDVPLPRQSSMLSEYADPLAAPELILIRETLRRWRFYDTFRVDALSPARRACAATFTPIMASDGADVPAAIQTIREIGDRARLDHTIGDAFPGSEIRIFGTDAGMQLSLKQSGMLRDLSAAELSDGTLRFLLLAAALLTPRPPELMVLNEPENSLHPDLIAPLARLIALAAENSQVIVVSHNAVLVDELEADEICVPIHLEKSAGETVLQDADLLSQYGWKWPGR
ncbi:high-affinity zinc transporter ATPase [Rubripirellula tenax]|uniref:High-affinity zinc transporter ATPase n=1 Tax=Rubripirellula tenax TaxID=2528015 RepID=A0A5C6EZR8_9BACT|nr:AAA family ATPase [Rubripirellula tenax]TWU54305.1 high-affinity zinc transporter ATPase [Rubripirellula tenax]